MSETGELQPVDQRRIVGRCRWCGMVDCGTTGGNDHGSGFADRSDKCKLYEAMACYVKAREEITALKSTLENLRNIVTTGNESKESDHENKQCRSCGSDESACCALVDALSEVLPQHAMACVSRLNLHDKPWSFDATGKGKPLVTMDSCQCSGESMRYLRALLPDGHPKGFSHNA